MKKCIRIKCKIIKRRKKKMREDHNAGERRGINAREGEVKKDAVEEV